MGSTLASQPPIHKPISVAWNVKSVVQYSHVISHMQSSSYQGLIDSKGEDSMQLLYSPIRIYTAKSKRNLLQFCCVLFSFWVYKPLKKHLPHVFVYRILKYTVSPDSGYKLMHAQLVCTRPFSRVRRGP